MHVASAIVHTKPLSVSLAHGAVMYPSITRRSLTRVGWIYDESRWSVVCSVSAFCSETLSQRAYFFSLFFHQSYVTRLFWLWAQCYLTEHTAIYFSFVKLFKTNYRYRYFYYCMITLSKRFNWEKIKLKLYLRSK